MGKERNKTCFDNWVDEQYHRWRKEIKHVSTTGLMNNIIGEERDKTCFDNWYDGQHHG